MEYNKKVFLLKTLFYCIGKSTFSLVTCMLAMKKNIGNIIILIYCKNLYALNFHTDKRD